MQPWFQLCPLCILSLFIKYHLVHLDHLLLLVNLNLWIHLLLCIIIFHIHALFHLHPLVTLSRKCRSGTSRQCCDTAWSQNVSTKRRQKRTKVVFLSDRRAVREPVRGRQSNEKDGKDCPSSRLQRFYWILRTKIYISSTFLLFSLAGRQKRKNPAAASFSDWETPLDHIHPIFHLFSCFPLFHILPLFHLLPLLPYSHLFPYFKYFPYFTFTL